MNRGDYFTVATKLLSNSDSSASSPTIPKTEAIMLDQTKVEGSVRWTVDVVLDALFGRLQPTSSSPKLLQTELNEHCQRQCRGCDEVCELLRWGDMQRRRDSAYQGSSTPRLLHNSYIELDHCAGVSKCDTCRIFRRALLLEQITGQDARRLKHSSNQGPIYAVLHLEASGDYRLSLAIQSPKTPRFPATIRLSSEPRPPSQDPQRAATPGLRANLDDLRQAIDDCRYNHECSSRHRWSHRNPTWLLKVLPDNHVQLVPGPPTPVDYVVLSYSWGDPKTMPPAEWARIKGAGTKTVNGRPVPERLSPFSTLELPETMQDAIALSASLGFSYVWIDNVCIPKGTNWDSEASIMHEVYGNSAFTLVASSSGKATDHLLHDRLAWTHRSKACKLRGLWLHDSPPSLDRVRFESPVAQRAWTLQEERLSPRIVYWAGQRWYWSCPERQVAEAGEPRDFMSPAADGEPCSRPQRFLELCHTGDEHQLHDEWLDIVEAYTRRDLVEPKDRFLAIAGLAVRFYNAKAATGGAAITEDYLAGLWKDDLARHLAWSVASAVDPEGNLQRIAPSWSWASLPLRVHTRAKVPFKPSEYFKLVTVERTNAARADDAGDLLIEQDQPRTEPERIAESDYINRGRAVEERGRNVKVLEVQGRFRRFIPDDAQEAPWEYLERKRASSSRPTFDFGAFAGQHIYARNCKDGRLMSKEAHSGEVVAQLDYLVPHSDDKPNIRATPCVEPGTEKTLMCLELGESAMLLLERHGDHQEGQPESYRRVGVAVGYGNRKGFFYGCETRRIRLV